MDGDDIFLERETEQVLKLDDNEQDLLRDIEVSQEPRKYRAPKKPKKRREPLPRSYVPDAEDINPFGNPLKMARPSAPQHQDVEPDLDDEQESYYEEEMQEAPYVDQEQIDNEKTELLSKLARLEKKGVTVNKRLNMYSSIEDIRAEYKRVMYSIEVDQSIRFSRRMLVACVTGLEFMNKKFNPIDVYLDGWSESVMENIDDYDGVFEELYAKYKSKIQVAPEIKLIMMLGGSAMMFHLTNSMFKTAIPNMNDVLKQNPALVQNMVEAVQNTQRSPATGPEPSVDANGRREMRGPGIDISSLMGGIMMPPPQPMNTSVIQESNESERAELVDDESVSDIISITGQSVDGEVKDVTVNTKKRRGRPPKNSKKEVSI